VFLLVLRSRLVLLRLWSRLPLLLLLGHLTLLLLRGRLPLLLLRSRLALLLLRSRLPLLLLRGRRLVLLRSRLVLLLLHYSAIGCLQRRWSFHVAIGRKRLVDRHIGRAATIRTGKLSLVGAGSTLILDLCPHGRSVRLMHRRQFGRPRTRLETT
jgi:hypothetical protein